MGTVVMSDEAAKHDMQAPDKEGSDGKTAEQQVAAGLTAFKAVHAPCARFENHKCKEYLWEVKCPWCSGLSTPISLIGNGKFVCGHCSKTYSFDPRSEAAVAKVE